MLNTSHSAPSLTRMIAISASMPFVIGWSSRVLPVYAAKFFELFLAELKICPVRYRRAFVNAQTILAAKAISCSTDPDDERSLRAMNSRDPRVSAAGVLHLCSAGDALSSLSGSVTDHSSVLVGHILSFCRHRRDINALWDRASGGLEVDARGVDLVEPSPGQFDAGMRQMSLMGVVGGGGGVPGEGAGRVGGGGAVVVHGMDELYAAAEQAQRVFAKVLYRLCDGHLQEASAGVGGGVVGVKLDMSQVVVAPLKGRDRAMEKAANDYGKREPGPGEAWLFDIVRGSIYCKSVQQVVAVVAALESLPPTVLQVVRLKNRFKKPTPAGFRDINMNLRVEIAPGVYHVCELQVHLKSIYDFDKAHGSHHTYEFFRSYFFGSNEAVEKRLKLFIDSGLFDASNNNNNANNTNSISRHGGDVHDSPLVLGDVVGLAVRRRDEGHLQSLLELLDVMGELELCERVAACLVDIRGGEQCGGGGGGGGGGEAWSIQRAESLMVLGALLVRRQDKDKLVEARPLFEESLAIYRREFPQLDDRHPLSASALSGLGGLLAEMGDLSAARPLLEKSLEVHRDLLDERHLLTADALFRLGDLYAKQVMAMMMTMTRDNAAAACGAVIKKDDDGGNASTVDGVTGSNEQHHQQQQRHHHHHHHDDHLLLLRSKAESLLEQSLSILRERLGASHPHVSPVLDALGVLRLDIAPLQQSLAIRRRARGDEHPDTATSLFLLGKVTMMINTLKTTNIKINGGPTTNNNVGVSGGVGVAVVAPVGEFDDVAGGDSSAAGLLHKCVLVRERVWGAGHRLTVAAREALAEAQSQEKKIKEEEREHEEEE